MPCIIFNLPKHHHWLYLQVTAAATAVVIIIVQRTNITYLAHNMPNKNWQGNTVRFAYFAVFILHHHCWVAHKTCGYFCFPHLFRVLVPDTFFGRLKLQTTWWNVIRFKHWYMHKSFELINGMKNILFHFHRKNKHICLGILSFMVCIIP